MTLPALAPTFRSMVQLEKGERMGTSELAIETGPSASASAGERQWRVLLSWGAIFGHVVFTAGWLLAGALEGHGYSAARHDTSDLAAATAHYAPLVLITQAIAGVLTVAFAIWALQPSLAGPGQRTVFGAWCVAGSLAGVELITEIFFRLDCRAADAGCTTADAMATWYGKLHVIVGFAALFMTIAAPFLLARRMRALPGFRDLVRPAIALGVALVATPVLYGVFFGSPVQGYMNRAPLVLASFGVAVLALRVRRLAIRTRT